MFAEVFAKDAVEGGEVACIFQPDSATHDVFRAVACFLQNRHEIFDSLAGLDSDVAGNDLTVCHGDLTGDVQPAVGLDGT